MKKSNILKKPVAIAMCAMMIASSCCISASAKTLSESFSGSTSMVCVSTDKWGNCTWAKKVTAKTSGYYKYHYVRAYIGGSSSSASGAIADSKRKYSYGDVTATAQGGRYTGSAMAAKKFIPTGYAKYGN